MIELDRPDGPQRRNGAKSDPLDAVRAAREALSRPRARHPARRRDRQALSVLLAARRSAVDAATVAQRQLFSLVIAAPERSGSGSAARSCPAMITHRRAAAPALGVGRRDHHDRRPCCAPWPAVSTP